MSKIPALLIIQKVVKIVLLSLIFITLLILGIIRTPAFGSFAAKMAEMAVNNIEGAHLEVGSLRFSGFLAVEFDSIVLTHPKIKVSASYLKSSISLYSLLLTRRLVITSVEAENAKVELVTKATDKDSSLAVVDTVNFRGFDPALIHLSVRQANLTNTIFTLVDERVELDIKVERFVGNLDRGSFLSDNMPGGDIFIEGADVSVTLPEDDKNRKNRPRRPFSPQFLLTFNPLKIDLNSSRFHLRDADNGLEIETKIGNISLTTQSLRIVEGIDVEHLKIVDTHTRLQLPQASSENEIPRGNRRRSRVNFNIRLKSGILENVSYTMGNLKSVNYFDPLNFNAEVINGAIGESEVNVRPFFVKSELDDFNIEVNKTREIEDLRTTFFMNRDSIEVTNLFAKTQTSRVNIDAKSNLDFSSFSDVNASLNLEESVISKKDAAFFAKNFLEGVNFDTLNFESVWLNVLANTRRGSFKNASVEVKIDTMFHLNASGSGSKRGSEISFNSETALFCNSSFFTLLDAAIGTNTSSVAPDSLRFSGVIAGTNDSIFTNSEISINSNSSLGLLGFVSHFGTPKMLRSHVAVEHAVVNVGDIYRIANISPSNIESKKENISVKGTFGIENGTYTASIDFSSPFLSGDNINASFTPKTENSTTQISANMGTIKANGKALTHLLPKGVLPNWMQLPREIESSIEFNYSNDKLTSKIDAKTSSGNVVGDITVNGVRSTQKEITAALTGRQLDINYITNGNAKIDKTDLALNARFELDNNKLHLWHADLQVEQAYVSNIRHSLTLRGHGNDSLYNLQVSALGNYINANINTKVKYNREAIFATIDRLQFSVDLVKLGVQDSGEFFVNANLNGFVNHKFNNESSEAQLSFNTLNAKLNDISLNLNGSKLLLNNSLPTGVSLSWKSQFVNFALTSSEPLNRTLGGATELIRASVPFFTLNEPYAKTVNTVYFPSMEFNLLVSQVENVFSVAGQSFNLDASISSKITKKNTHLAVKFLNAEFNEVIADSIILKLSYNYLQEAALNMQMYNINAFEMVDGNLEVDAKIENRTGNWTISMDEYKTSVERFFVAFSAKRDFSGAGSFLVIRPTTSNFILNHQHWLADTTGFIKIGDGTLRRANLTLGSDNKRVTIKRLGQIENNPVVIEAENFQLNDVFASLGIGEYLAASVSGFIRLYELRKGVPLFTAGLEINNIVFRADTIGNLSVAAGKDNHLYSGNARLKGEKAVLDLFFVSDMGVSPANTKGNINIEKIDLSQFEKYLGNIDAEGVLTGRLAFSSNNGEHNVLGNILFNDVAFSYGPTKTNFNIDDQKVTLSQTGINLNSFIIKDSENNTLTLNGRAELRRFDEPIALNITGLAENFVLMNSSRRDNPNFWGKVILSSDFSIAGSHILPIIAGRVKLDQGSALNMDLQAPERTINQRRRILLFQEEYLEMATQADTVPVRERGVIVNLEAEIDRNTSLTLHIDPVSGSVLTVEGTGNLNVSYDQGGTFNITGAYEIVQGMYSMNIYRVINRSFAIQEGSRIVWMGGPADAEASIMATHSLRASPEAIIGQRGSPLPFLVNLNMRGNIVEPNFSFAIDMPINERNAHNGAVYSAISAINADESQLNMQVLSLLIAGRFLGEYAPVMEQTPREAVVLEVSRSAGNIFSQELNRIAGKYITAADVSFDFENYSFFTREGQLQSRSEINVEVERQFFNNRVSVKVGERILLDEAEMANYSGFTGNVVVEYSLTPDGRYRISGYRKNEYGNFIEQNATKTGVRFIFDHSYD